MADTYPIYVSNGILTQQHYEKIGDAIWYFMWCIDKTTREKTDAAGNIYGVVLGGMPVHDSSVASTFGVHVNTARNWRINLTEARYIKATRTPNGWSIQVAKSKKMHKRVTNNCDSQKIVTPPSEPQKTVIHSSLGVESQNNGIESQKTVNAIRQCSDSTKTVQDRLTDCADKANLDSLSTKFLSITGLYFEINSQVAIRLLEEITKYGMVNVDFALDGFARDDHKWEKVKKPAVLFLSKIHDYLPTELEDDDFDSARLAHATEPSDEQLRAIEAATVLIPEDNSFFEDEESAS
jgi:hypothetical protein